VIDRRRTSATAATAASRTSETPSTRFRRATAASKSRATADSSSPRASPAMRRRSAIRVRDASSHSGSVVCRTIRPGEASSLLRTSVTCMPAGLNSDAARSVSSRLLAFARNAQKVESLVRDVRIERRDVHSERSCTKCNFASDSPQSDNRETAAAKLGAEQVAAVPATFAHRSRCAWNVSHESDKRSKEKLGNGDRVSCRGIDDRDAKLGCGRNVDVVGADTRSADYAKFCSALEYGGRKLCRASPDECVIVSDSLRQLCLRECRHFIDDEFLFCAKAVDSFAVDLVSDEKAKATHPALASASFSALRRTFPTWVFGRSATNSNFAGTL